ncbi:hypothetical protein XELAEV_18024914mg [Xenopus laevis]|uniref:Uncharacterized protein n=1 Tax=Xenopus laevis TaxID=8355 RepID=A0A974CZR8_XENLA|nr:hypothetical protein XELAEV_18024914mg [Xenopus laevis]
MQAIFGFCAANHRFTWKQISTLLITPLMEQTAVSQAVLLLNCEAIIISCCSVFLLHVSPFPPSPCTIPVFCLWYLPHHLMLLI